MKRAIYQIIASRLSAMLNCEKNGNVEWLSRHAEKIENIVKEYMPSGSGIDAGTKFDFDASKPERLVFTFGFHHMNDGASFEGEYRYAKGAAKAIRQHAPKDETLHTIADQLQALQRANFYQVRASIKQSGSYVHEYTMRADAWRFDERDISEQDQDALLDLMRDFARWIYRQLEQECEYQSSNEAVDESIEANEYEFTAERVRT
jgi:hypothetical protein